MVYAKHNRTTEALEALQTAEAVDPGYDMTFVYRGNIYEKAGDRAAAVREYTHALALNPPNQSARDGLLRVSR
jgi:predicted TPR repeat methyltransferase